MMGETEQQREIKAVHMRKRANPKTLSNNSHRKQIQRNNFALTDHKKLITVILIAPREYAQTIHTAR